MKKERKEYITPNIRSLGRLVQKTKSGGSHGNDGFKTKEPRLK